MKTEIVYVISPDFWRYLFLSLRTLLTSGTHLEQVRIYLVADSDPGWSIDDDRITVELVPDISARGEWGSYWGNNKIHLCKSEADRVIYLDTDVMVQRPLHLVYEETQADLVARYGVSTYMDRYYDPDRWASVLEAAGTTFYPKYSPGFMVFQNGAHRRIEKTWHKVIEKILNGELPLPVNKHAELYAFSIAASIENLSHHPMKERDHRYAMIGEGHEDAVVYHLGTPGFYRHYLPIEEEIGLDSRTDLPVPRPRFTEVHDFYTRVRHRLKHKILGPRDTRLEY